LKRPDLIHQPIAEILTRLGLGPNFDLHQARELRQVIELPMASRDGAGSVVLELSVQATQVPEEPTLLMLRDITQRLLIEQHLGHAQRLEAVGQLAGGIAHDFNNLLTAIGGGAEMIMMDGDPASRELAQQILQAQRRGGNLTHQLLAFARRDIHQPKAIDLAATVADMAGIVERLLGKQHQLHLARTEPVWIEADEAQIEQLVLNLVTNACDAMPRGGRVSVTVRPVAGAEAGRLGSRLPDARQAHLEVTDTGTGIPPELHTRIFEPFFTTKPRGKGTGLGLAAVQGSVAQNHGCLSLSSKVGEGTSFHIFFPIAAGSGDSRDPLAAEATPAVPGVGRILVVDDEEFVLKTAAQLLRHSGYEVFSATHGEEALAVLARSGPFSLVLTDLAMPGMNGRELGERIRALYPSLPLLYMSGYFNDPKLSPPPAAAEAGYLAKPFTSKQLLAAVRTMLPS
jgi:two-component system cell cycle sensor histidine kinase/response regulator CckA